MQAPAVFAVVVLLVNDHCLKQLYPGVVTGKLSDFAGLFFFPWLLHASWVVVIGAPRSLLGERRLLLGCVWAVGIVFAAIQVVPLAADAYVWGMGTLQWGPRALLATAQGISVPRVTPVMHVADPTDLIALSVLVLVARPSARGWRVVLVVGLLVLGGCASRRPPRGGPMRAEVFLTLDRQSSRQSGRLRVSIPRSELERKLRLRSARRWPPKLSVAVDVGHSWVGPADPAPSVLTGTLRVSPGPERREDIVLDRHQQLGMMVLRGDVPFAACSNSACVFDVFVDLQWHHPSAAAVHLTLHVELREDANYEDFDLRWTDVSWTPISPLHAGASQ